MGSSVVSSILVLLAVAFYTLMERKILGYIMLRKGPNKPGLVGFITPLADAAKLLSKTFVLPTSGSRLIVCSSASLLFLSLMFCFGAFIPRTVLPIFLHMWCLFWHCCQFLSLVFWELVEAQIPSTRYLVVTVL